MLKLLLCPLALLLAATLTASPLPQVLLDGQPCLAGRLMLQLNHPVQSETGSCDDTELDQLLARLGATQIRRHFIRYSGDRDYDRYQLSSFLLVDFQPDADLAALRDLIAKQSSVKHVSADWIAHLNLAPDDTMFPQQWALDNHSQAVTPSGALVGTIGIDIGAPLSWDWVGGESVGLVAILDTGVDPTHGELQDRLLPGFNFIINQPGASDDHGHGTRVAGIIAARGNNALGVAGICWNTQVLPIKVFNALGQGLASAMANGLNFARVSEADVANYSGGLPYVYEPAVTQIEMGRQSGMLTVAAAGNMDTEGIEFPASLETCVAVGACSPCGERASATSCDGESGWGSNWGTGLDLLAPGVRLASTNIASYTTSFNGTSAACAHVSGVALLLASTFPELEPADIHQILQQSALDLGDPGYDRETGWGLLRLDRAISMATPTQMNRVFVTRLPSGLLQLEWAAVPGAQGYNVYRLEEDNSRTLIDVAMDHTSILGAPELRRGKGRYVVTSRLPVPPERRITR